MKKNNIISKLFVLCLTLAMFVSAASASALPVDDVEMAGGVEIAVEPEQVQDPYAVQPRGVVYYMKYFETLRDAPGSSNAMGYADADDIVDNYTSGTDCFGYDSDLVLWRHIVVVNGFCLGFDGWVPNSSVTSYNT